MKTSELTINDVGKELELESLDFTHGFAKKFIVMCIKSPNGRIFFFDKPWENEWYYLKVDKQCEAIESFMKC